jgi:hypothetical protein
MKKLILFFVLSLAMLHFCDAQSAELHIKNNSGRTMLIKIMNSNTNRLYRTLRLSAYENVTEYFSETNKYYCKTEARKQGSESIYEKGKAFEVYVGRDGYSVLTITFSVSESNSPNVLGGSRISKDEFDRN